MALSGMSRKEAAEAAGMDRQTLRDWVIRYNAHGLDGLYDCWGDGRPPRLEPEEQAELIRIVLAGPDPEADGVSAFTREDLVRICEARFGKSFHPASMGRLLKRLGFSRQKARPSHPQKDPAQAEAFKKSPGRFFDTSAYVIKASACACSFRTRRASARRAASVMSGGSAASGRRGFATGASPSPISSRP